MLDPRPAFESNVKCVWFPRADLFGIENSTTSQFKYEEGNWNDFKL